MRFEVSIKIGNDAMERFDHVRDALRGVADRLFLNGCFPDKFQNIYDGNGNVVGTYGIRDKDVNASIK